MTSTIGWKALTDSDRNAWLSKTDPDKLLEDVDSDLKVGYFDANGDGVRGTDEGIHLFEERVRGANVYVIVLTPVTGSSLFTVELRLKAKDGTLTAVNPTLVQGDQWALLRSQGFALTEANLNALDKQFSAWSKESPPDVAVPVGYSLSTTSHWQSGESRYCPIGGNLLSDRKNYQSFTFNPSLQGNLESGPWGWNVGGWGAWVADMSDEWGTDYEFYRQISCYEAYELGLSGNLDKSQSDILNGNFQNWAGKKGIDIGLVTVTLNGKPTQTMGFKTSLNGHTYEFYWDPTAGGHRIGKVSDAGGKDITQSVLALQTTQVFGKSWEDIKSKLVLTSGNGASLGVYGAGFAPENTSGSAEAPTEAEIALFNAFLANPRWADYLDTAKGRLKSLPSSKAEQQALLNDLQKLNPAHILKLLTGNEDVNGLNLLTQLIQSLDITDSTLLKAGEWIGKLMYLAGRELARKAGKSEHKSATDFFTALHEKLAVMGQQLAEIAVTKGFDLKIMEKLYFNVLLGLRNYTGADGPVNAPQLTVEDTLVWLINRLSSAGEMSSSSYSAENARALVSFSKSLIQLAGTYMALHQMKYGSDVADQHASSGLLVSLYLQEQIQKLYVLVLGGLGLHAANSTTAKDTFDNAQKTSHEDSRKLQDALAALLSKFWDLFLELIKTMVK